MPRRASGPRLYLDKRRRQWAIRDGSSFIRTGCAEAQLEWAEKLLAKYIAAKYSPPRSDSPPVADILLFYLKDRVPSMKSRSAKYNVSNLSDFWGDKTLAEVTAANCRAYAKGRTQSAARADLEKLQSAIRHWHKEHTPLAVVPTVWKPPRNAPRERWLTVPEAARLVQASKRAEHLKRFVLLGLYTGSRAGVLRNLEWSWIDLEAGTMRRRAPGASETANKRTPPIRLPRKLKHFLRRWKEADGGKVKYVVHYNGQQIKRDPWRSWKEACKAAKLVGVHPHVLRHTRATWMVQRGVQPWQAAGYLGMTVRVLEATYGHHSPDWQADAADI
jgi:integrase